MAVLVKTWLGRYVRADRQDFTRERREAADFESGRAADEWVVDNYGRNGLRFFSPEYVNEDEDDGAE